MNELLKEIEDDIRRERFDKLWNGFGKIMVGISVAVILGTIVTVIMQNHHESQAMEQTTQFIHGVERFNIEDYKGAITAFAALAKDESSPYYGLSMLRKAQAEDASGDHAAARKTYEEMASHDAVLGQVGGLLAASGDKLFKPSKDSPFYYTQSEWDAWQLLKQGKKDEAVAIFKTLRDDESTPASMRDRVIEAIVHLAPDAVAFAKPTPKEPDHE